MPKSCLSLLALRNQALQAEIEPSKQDLSLLRAKIPQARVSTFVQAVGQLTSARMRIALQQALSSQPQQVAINGPAIRSWGKLQQNIVGPQESIGVGKDLQDFAFRHGISRR